LNFSIVARMEPLAAQSGLCQMQSDGFDCAQVVHRRKHHQRLFTERDNPTSQSFVQTAEHAVCPDCGTVLTDADAKLWAE